MKKSSKQKDKTGELSSYKQYVDISDYTKQDTYPVRFNNQMIQSLAPQPQYSDNSITIEELKHQIVYLTDTLNHETSTNKILENKCEEYLLQLQRSADIIESAKNKHDAYVDQTNSILEEKDMDLSSMRDTIKMLNRDIDELGAALRQRELSEHRNVDSSIAMRDLMGEKDGVIGEIREKLASAERENSELREGHARLGEENSRLRRDVDRLQAGLNMKESEMGRLLENGGGGHHLQERIIELKEDNTALKLDKDKLFAKIDTLTYDNEHLRNEIFMLKKYIIELERNSSNSHQLSSHPINNNPGEERIAKDTSNNRRRYMKDADVDRMRNDRSSTKQDLKTESDRHQGRDINRDSIRRNQQPDHSHHHHPQNNMINTSTKQSGLFNKSSTAMDIITWNNPPTNAGIVQGGQRNGQGTRVQEPGRSLQLLDEQLNELFIQRNKMNNELNSINTNQPKTGLTMKRKRELEDKVDMIEKQISSIKSKIRQSAK